MRLLLTLLIAFTIIFVLSVAPALATNNWLHNIGIADGALIPVGCTDSESTPCGLTEAFQTIINFTQILLAMTGSVMILMFVYGGTMMIIGGAAKEEYITKGKDAIKAAVIGLIIILGAWLMINFTILALTKGEVGGTAQLFGRGFSETPTGGESICQSGIVAPPGTGLCDPLCGGGGTEGSLMSDGQVCCNCFN